MNIPNIRKIVTQQASDEAIISELIKELSKDKNLLPTLLLILEQERKENQELTKELNLLLSKAHTGLEEPKFNKDGFMQKEITEFYKKGKIGHCFKKIS